MCMLLTGITYELIEYEYSERLISTYLEFKQFKQHIPASPICSL